jgi:N-acetylglucosaminylphosphatidylinositol deacetylase
MILTSRHLVSTSLPTVPTYELKTIFVLRKYAILLDLPVTLILSIPRLLKTLFYGDEKGSWGLMVASPNMYFNARRAFTQHASQVVWDRYVSIDSAVLTAGGFI